MHESLLPQLAAIIVLGVAAQWLAWRVGLPSILLLLVFGLLAGPVTGLINPDEVFGDLLFPIVSVSVALILYEGGLTLKLRELPAVGGVVRNLVTWGALITWGVGALLGHLIFGLGTGMSVLLGSIVVVTGPTVIAPLLRHIRPTGTVGPILRWEGIVIDPIGALLTVLVFKVILAGDAGEATAAVVVGVLKTVVVGGGLGVAAAGLLVLLLKRYWIADYLQSAVSLMLVVGVFALSNAVQHEAGLLAVTVMGFVLANQKLVDVEHIVEFKENLRVLLISTPFIVLAARLDLRELQRLAAGGLLFAGGLILIARPLGVWLATRRSSMPMQQRVFMAWMAPRGIVAAAVSSVLAMRLEAQGYEEARILVPITFMTIIVTVALYGLSSPLLARWLRVAESNPQGVLLAGGHAWAREIAALLQEQGYRVLIVDTNRENIAAARMAGLPTYLGSILAEHTLDELELGGIGRLWAITPNDWVNVLTVHRFERVFGRASCYQIPSVREPQGKGTHKYLHGRWLFNEDATYATMARCQADGFKVKATRLSQEFNFDAFRNRYGDSAITMFIVDENRRLNVIAADDDPHPRDGDTLISFVREPAD